jgi:hypothetical protein
MSLKALAQRVLQGNQRGNLRETESFLTVQPVPQNQETEETKFPAPVAWIEGGELRTAGQVDNLAAEIVKLTSDNLDLQKRLLLEYCQPFQDTHRWRLVDQWEERSAILEYEAGLPRQEAEKEAARMYHLTAWLRELGFPKGRANP